MTGHGAAKAGVGIGGVRSVGQASGCDVTEFRVSCFSGD